jgi:hypothetical protein
MPWRFETLGDLTLGRRGPIASSPRDLEVWNDARYVYGRDWRDSCFA